jgi:hypothetical protein
MNEPKWYIETYNEKGRLVDINEFGYETLEECQKAIDEMVESDREWKEKCMEEYAEKLRAFVMDEDCSDREPFRPVFFEFTYKPKRYILDERGYTEVG